jgi:hypothetical protein
MKWLWVVLLVVIGAFFTYMAVEYLTVSIAHIPSWFPGHKAAIAGHHARGHYRKGGAGAALLALISFVAAGFLAYRFASSSSGPSASAPTTADTPGAAGTTGAETVA